ncbi:MAG: aldehyde ferredoxin oxidoreductase C-terminal domain-containing protein, partial [Candidatus Hadarchaeales archaeon]
VHRYPLWEGVAKILSAATGVEFTVKTIVDALERIYSIERAFLIRQGIKRKDDRLVLRPHLKGTEEGAREIANHERLLTEYYTRRQWDPVNGIPTREKLESLGMKYVADELERNIPYPDWDGPPYWPLERYPHGGTRA